MTIMNDMPAVAALLTEDPDEGALHPLLAEVIEGGPYQPKWASLVKHPLPAWFRDDKIGMSAHWGPYSVPGWTPRKDSPYGVAYAEWYWEWLKENPAVKDYHKKHYGDAVYDDFIDGTENLVTGEIDGFNAEKFDADAWIKLIKDAGAKYFYITSKHHDGFCIWDTAYTDRCAGKMGPKRDLYGELVAAARRAGLRIGFYYSLYEWNNPIYCGQDDISGYKGCKALKDQGGDGVGNEYVDDFMVPQIKELIDTYHPDYICFDGEWDHNYLYWRARQIVAYFYNQAVKRGQEVVINDRFGQAKDGLSDTRGIYGDFRHVEYFANVDRDQAWAMWRGFGNSFGYNRNEHPNNILSVTETIQMMVDLVSQNGNVEFNLAPKADGTFAGFELERMAAMGRWLQANGEGIYGTTKGPLGEQAWGVSTQKGNDIYLHIFRWPTCDSLKVQGLGGDIKAAHLLHDPGRTLPYLQPDDFAVVIDLAECTPFEHVSTVKLTFAGAPDVTRDVFPDEDGIVTLRATAATLSGGLKVERKGDDGVASIGHWSNLDATARWEAQLPQGEYAVSVEIACEDGHAGGRYTVDVGGNALSVAVVEATGGWEEFKAVALGQIALGETRTVEITLKADSIPESKSLFNLRTVTLTPVLANDRLTNSN